MQRQCPLRITPLSRLFFTPQANETRFPLDDTSMYSGRLRFDVPKDEDSHCEVRLYYTMIFCAKWILINAPVIVISWIFAMWLCEWSIPCAVWGFMGIVAASLWYYWVHRIMHDPTAVWGANLGGVIAATQTISWFHRANHHGEADVLSPNLKRHAFFRAIVAVAEWIYEIVVIGGAVIALIPALPRPMRVFAFMFAVFCAIMHHANCHGKRVYSLFHSAHHVDAQTNFMPEIWDNVFGTMAEGKNAFRVVDENYVFWIIVSLVVAVKLISRKYGVSVCG